MKFRGMTKSGEEIEGNLIIHNAYDLNDTIRTHKDILRAYIESSNYAWNSALKCWKWHRYEVIPNSLSMSTGQIDKNKKEIFGSIPLEDGTMSKGGDRCVGKDPDGYEIEPFEVKFEHGMWVFYALFDGFDYTSIQCAIEMGYEFEVIGTQYGDGYYQEYLNQMEDSVPLPPEYRGKA